MARHTTAALSRAVVRRDGFAWFRAARPAGARIAGSVFRRWGTPVAGATLVLIDRRGLRSDRGVTDSCGGYTLTAPADGAYLLAVSAPGHRVWARPVSVAGASLRVDVVLVGSGTVTGAVTAADGRSAIDGAEVTLTEVSGRVRRTRTAGPHGGYTFADVVAGAYTLVVSAPPDPPVARGIVVQADEVVRVDVAVGARLSLRGIVRARGWPVAGVRVSLLDGIGGPVRSAVTDSSGEYVFDGVSEGRYTVVAVSRPPAGDPSRLPHATVAVVLTPSGYGDLGDLDLEPAVDQRTPGPVPPAWRSPGAA